MQVTRNKPVAGLCLLCLLFVCIIAQRATAQESTERSHIDIFCGVDFNYRDITHNRVYDILINLTPGVKWYLPRHWQANVLVLVPVYNDYGGYYKRVRLNMVSLSKEWYLSNRFFLKASGGLFSQERYGLDLKAMYIVTSWLALRAQTGWTGFCSMATGWKASTMDRWTGQAEADLYLHHWNTEFRIRGGQFIYKDRGGIVEAMRHFTHCTVGIFGQYTDQWKGNAGFKVIMMIPPYKRKQRKVNVRPASNFRFTNNFDAEAYSARMYYTDPEENEREGWFDRRKANWGINTMTRDFEVKPNEKSDEEK